MTTLYTIGGLIAILILTYAANSAHRRRMTRIEMRRKYGGPFQRLFRRLK